MWLFLFFSFLLLFSLEPVITIYFSLVALSFLCNMFPVQNGDLFQRSDSNHSRYVSSDDWRPLPEAWHIPGMFPRSNGDLFQSPDIFPVYSQWRLATCSRSLTVIIPDMFPLIIPDMFPVRNWDLFQRPDNNHSWYVPSDELRAVPEAWQ